MQQLGAEGCLLLRVDTDVLYPEWIRGTGRRMRHNFQMDILGVELVWSRSVTRVSGRAGKPGENPSR